MIEVRCLSKFFRRRRIRSRRGFHNLFSKTAKFVTALENVTFCADKGTIVGILGPNGAGKTTLLRILSTAIKPNAGTASFDGVDIVESPLEVRKRIGFLSDNTGLYGRLTAREMIQYFGRLHGLARAPLSRRIDELAALLDMSEFIDKRNDSLSSGMKQKVSIARTLVHNPDFVMFDEPTTGLDVAAAEAILKFIEDCKAGGKTVLFCTHHMHEVERLCDKVIILHQGRLCFHGSVEEMRSRTGQAHLDKAFLSLIDSEPTNAG